MYRGKHSVAKKHSKKPAILLASLVLIISLAAGVTAAYLFTGSTELRNSFTPAKVSCQISESFDGSVKSNVCVSNTGNVDAYIRASILVNWVDDEGNYIPAPEGCSYAISPPDGKWQQSGEYYYYSAKIAPGGSTSQLIPSAAPVGSAPGCHLKVDVIADAIQAEPVSAVRESWGWMPPAVA